MLKNRMIIVMIAAGFILSCNDEKTSQETKTDKTTQEDRKSSENTSDTTTRQSKANNSGWDEENVSKGWAEAEENRFMSDCQSTASKKVTAAQAYVYCDCMLQKIMKRFESYAIANRELSGSDEEMDELAQKCNSQKP